MRIAIIHTSDSYREPDLSEFGAISVRGYVDADR